MAAVKSKDTTPEMFVRRLVHSLGFRYRLHVRTLPGTPDMVFPRLRKIINVNGCFWHRHCCGKGRSLPTTHRRYWKAKLTANKTRDIAARRKLRRLGWKVLVVWECQTAKQNLARLEKRLVDFLQPNDRNEL
ncbi:MAG: DNA mismatch endonuclease Vsr [Pirellulaceae bacterium]|nr:DNA mismatch endonuclease Vsr [Pirellulaceae bacterium]